MYRLQPVKHKFFAGSFMKTSSSLKVLKNLELGSFKSEIWNKRFCHSENLELEVLSS